MKKLDPDFLDNINNRLIEIHEASEKLIEDHLGDNERAQDFCRAFVSEAMNTFVELAQQLDEDRQEMIRLMNEAMDQTESALAELAKAQK